VTDQTPLDQFRQALTGAARALAQEAEVEIAWTADAPAQSGRNFRVPLPGRNLPPQQAREARGHADSFALKLKHHSEAVHASGAPPEPIAS
jgi:cobaltochelatase CobT